MSATSNGSGGQSTTLSTVGTSSSPITISLISSTTASPPTTSTASVTSTIIITTPSITTLLSTTTISTIESQTAQAASSDSATDIALLRSQIIISIALSGTIILILLLLILFIVLQRRRRSRRLDSPPLTSLAPRSVRRETNLSMGPVEGGEEMAPIIPPRAPERDSRQGPRSINERPQTGLSPDRALKFGGMGFSGLQRPATPSAEDPCPRGGAETPQEESYPVYFYNEATRRIERRFILPSVSVGSSLRSKLGVLGGAAQSGNADQRVSASDRFSTYASSEIFPEEASEAADRRLRASQIMKGIRTDTD